MRTPLTPENFASWCRSLPEAQQDSSGAWTSPWGTWNARSGHDHLVIDGHPISVLSSVGISVYPRATAYWKMGSIRHELEPAGKEEIAGLHGYLQKINPDAADRMDALFSASKLPRSGEDFLKWSSGIPRVSKVEWELDRPLPAQIAGTNEHILLQYSWITSGGTVEMFLGEEVTAKTSYIGNLSSNTPVAWNLKPEDLLPRLNDAHGIALTSQLIYESAELSLPGAESLQSSPQTRAPFQSER